MTRIHKKKIYTMFAISLILTLLSYTKVYASVEEGVAGVSITLENTDDEDVKTAFDKLRFTKADIKILYRIVEAENTGCSVESKKNTCSVVINRMMSKNFDNSIKEVVFAEGEFSSVGDKRYYEVEITDETKEAVDYVLKNGCTTEATYFFQMDYVTSRKIKNWIKTELEFLFTDDSGHSFYEEKED